ncbi:PF01863 family protein [Leptospira weilii str. 2006001855]|uniref:PF01863 family protein n=4 Tax=Leptospira weilii TaxID=28184 RepID=M6G0Z4_9LEPT|nr:PF01863 family protein [Leptospira weilii str. 2006001855]EMN42682.1 PF01863 family protein [Leptospira weilii str. LNT 1234]QDK22175.1 M48 family metallopeptidase [Leptospira weilii]QDK26120.1 M48 family metallopeptidase [Leptospira weilii]
MVYNLSYGSDTFKVGIRFDSFNEMILTVYPDLQIEARFPKDTKISEIEKKLSKRKHWIQKQIHYFEKFLPRQPARRYISGETHIYLGKQYILKLKQGTRSNVELARNQLIITSKFSEKPESVEKILNAWYNNQAKILITQRFKFLLVMLKKYKVQTPKLKFRKMQKRWGSCSREGVILLNTELVKTPITCIDYVIVHEFCHLKFPKHDLRFYKMLNDLLPDWEYRKDRLERSLFI